MVDDESIQSIKLRRSSYTANHTTPKHVIGKHVGLLAYPASLSSPAHHEARRWSLSSLVLCSFVLSIFAIIILSVLGLVYKNNHEEFVGGIEDPEDGSAVASTVFVAVLVYVGFLVCCGLQGLLHMRESRRGAIAL
ncbi:hypothetical protein N8I77_004248 [Diaporthe amygdali]|uniref:Uncharacterized protein n=1 Tax=Phomopsis amygdali TaxID=1214568 RepID=A0AAD9W6T2_PHOAM|nr:hypothetical protein N8I77_004248 [Diaporthe amygdali]